MQFHLHADRLRKGRPRKSRAVTKRSLGIAETTQGDRESGWQGVVGVSGTAGNRSPGQPNSVPLRVCARMNSPKALLVGSIPKRV